MLRRRWAIPAWTHCKTPLGSSAEDNQAHVLFWAECPEGVEADPCSTASPETELLRRVASIPTHGDGLIDRDLLVLADQLEEEADVTEEYLKPAAMPEDGSSMV